MERIERGCEGKVENRRVSFTERVSNERSQEDRGGRLFLRSALDLHILRELKGKLRSEACLLAVGIMCVMCDFNPKSVLV